jgi:hypothetical protein
MKKSFSAVLAAAVLVLGLAVFFASCGGGGGGSSTPGNTTISTPTQGAQSASATVSTFRSMSNTSSSLIGMASVGTGPTSVSFAVGQSSTAAAKFAARFAPAAKKARAMRYSIAASPQTTSCLGGGNTIMDMDASGTSLTMTFNSCKEGGTLTDGAVVLSGISQASSSGNISIGTDARPFVETTYSSSTSTVVSEVSTGVFTMNFTATDTSTANPKITATVNGYSDVVDHVAHTHEKQVMNNFTIKGMTLGSTTTIGGVTYDVVTSTIDGTVTGTTYVSDTNAAISYQEGPNTFTNVVIVDKSPSSGTGDEYFSIDGMISISTTPADRCIDGTFTIVTNTALQIDGATGQTKAGKMTINGNVVATFNIDGSVTVSVDGGTPLVYTRAALDTICAL